MDTIEDENIASNDEKPPIFNEWKSWYLLVISELLVLILLFYWFTRSFS